MEEKKKTEVGSFKLNGFEITLVNERWNEWVLTVTSISNEQPATTETFYDVHTAVKAFEQSVRGVFFQTKYLPYTAAIPNDFPVEVKKKLDIKDRDTGRIQLVFDPHVEQYDLELTKETYITTIRWPYLRNKSDPINTMRLRIFCKDNFKVLFDRVVWDNSTPPIFTPNGYDIVELRCRGDGVVKGRFFLNVPDQKNDSKLLLAGQDNPVLV